MMMDTNVRLARWCHPSAILRLPRQYRTEKGVRLYTSSLPPSSPSLLDAAPSRNTLDETVF